VIDVAFAIPGDLDALTGGYAYDRRLIQHLPAHGVTAHHIALSGSFPDPTSDDLETTQHLLSQIAPATPILFDGLAFGALPPEIVTAIASPVIALVHHPLALETGLDTTRQRQFQARERFALQHATAVIATSPTTGRTLLRDYAVEAVRLTIAEPGTSPAIRASGTGRPFTMLAVGSLIPRKGYPVLIDAVTRLTASHAARLPDWRLTIVGSTAHSPGEANVIRECLLQSGLRRNITLAGEVSARDLSRLYARADLFVMPSLYEGYGMVLAEAMARGLPIVATTGGAAAETVPDDTAIKVPPGDPNALAEALATVMFDADCLARMARASWDAGRRLPDWPATAARVADTLKAVAARRPTDGNHSESAP
jgi:glycosyltransferase involved in cell wall biosynthesis